MKHPTGPALGPIWVMVAKRGSEQDPLRSALDALARELEAATKGDAAARAADIDLRAKALASLSKTAEILFDLLQKQSEGATPGRSPSEVTERRDSDVWKEIERRLARLRAAEEKAADNQTARPGKAEGSPR